MATRQLQHRYVQTFGIVVICLALVRCIFPGVSSPCGERPAAATAPDSSSVSRDSAETALQTPSSVYYQQTKYLEKGQRRHPVHGVHSYAEAFPDSNHVQLQAAARWGVKSIKDREEAEQRKEDLVYIGNSPYYAVARLNASIPYLVPHAALLLQDIGRAFIDSLQVKGLPLHRVIVSSVLRTEADVARLRRSNHNATEQSCHLYGTTFDIKYNDFLPLTSKEGNSDKLKYVLSEVLRDLRQQDRCFIKYEMKEPCFHITVR